MRMRTIASVRLKRRTARRDGGAATSGGGAAVAQPERTPAEQAPAPVEPFDIAKLRALQAGRGNAYVQRIVRSAPPVTSEAPAYVVQRAKTVTYPTTVKVSGESVIVESEAETTEAKQIIAGIKKDYGITVKSKSGVSAIKKSYTAATKDVKKTLSVGVWAMKELRALKSALVHFAPILGKNRKGSSRKGDKQEITSVSKVKQAIDSNSAQGVLDSTTLGEFFASSKNFSMFDAGTGSTVDFTDNLKQLEGTAVHEIAHGLMKHVEAAWLTEFSYWTDRNTKSGADDAEAPITEYGQTNLGEDMAEAVMYFFVDNATLLTKCPDRHAFITKETASWNKKKSD